MATLQACSRAPAKFKDAAGVRCLCNSISVKQVVDDIEDEGNWVYTLLVNPFDPKGNYSDTLNSTKLTHWPLRGGLLHLVQRGWAWAGCGSPSPLLAVPNVTAHPSTASVQSLYCYMMVRCSAVLM